MTTSLTVSINAIIGELDEQYRTRLELGIEKNCTGVYELLTGKATEFTIVKLATSITVMLPTSNPAIYSFVPSGLTVNLVGLKLNCIALT